MQADAIDGGGMHRPSVKLQTTRSMIGVIGEKEVCVQSLLSRGNLG